MIASDCAGEYTAGGGTAFGFGLVVVVVRFGFCSVVVVRVAFVVADDRCCGESPDEPEPAADSVALERCAPEVTAIAADAVAAAVVTTGLPVAGSITGKVTADDGAGRVVVEAAAGLVVAAPGSMT